MRSDAMGRVARNGLVQHRRRVVSTVAAVVVAVAFLTSVSTLSDSVRGTFDSMFTSLYGRTDAVVTAKGTLTLGFRRAPQRLPRLTILQLAKVPGIASVDGMVVGYAQVVGTDGRPVGGANSLSFGSIWTDDNRFNPFAVAEGRKPRADDEVVLDRTTARLGRIRVGDRITVLTVSEPTAVTVVGITRFGRADSPGGLGYVHFTGAAADRLFRTDNKIDQILLAAAPGTTPEALKRDVAAALGRPDAYDVYTGAEALTVRRSEFQDRLAGFTVFLTLFAGIALVVAAFVIFNTFQIVLNQRQRELALLRAIGASRRQIVGNVLAEAVALGVVGAGVGLGLGLLAAAGAQSVLADAGIPLTTGPLVVSAGSVARALACGVVTTVAAALVPAWRASRVPPVAAMAQAAVEPRRPSPLRTAAGVVAGVIGTVAVVAGAPRGQGAVAAVGAGGLVVVAALVLLDPHLLRALARLSRRNGHRRIPGLLASDNVARSARRNAVTAFPLLFGSALVGVLLVFTASFRAQVDATIDGQFKGDLFVTSRTGNIGFSTEVAATVARLPGVAELTPVRFMFIDPRFVDGAGGAEPAGIVGVDTASVLGTIDIPVLAGSVSTMTPGTVAVERAVADRHGWAVGDAISVAVRGSPETPVTVAAIIDTTRLTGLFRGANALVGLDTFDRINPVDLDQALYIRTGADEPVDTVRSRIEQALATYPTVEVGDATGYKRLIDRQVRPFIAFMFVLLAISVAIAMIGVANTLSLAINERTRELGLLRAIGMHVAQSRAMVRWEAATIATFGVGLGSVVGGVFGVAFMRALRSQGFTVTRVPVPSFVLVGMVTVALGVVAATGAVRRVTRIDVLRAIAVD